MKRDKKTGLKIYIVVPAIAGFICVAAIVAAVLLGAPAKVNAARVGKQLDLGNKYLASADYDNAEVTFNKALKIDPKSVEAATGMAKIYNKKGQPQKALQYVEKASDNLTTPTQAQELQAVYNNTKKQLNNTDKNNSKNEETFGEIEKIIDETIHALTPTGTPTPTPTKKDKPVLDDNAQEGSPSTSDGDSDTDGDEDEDKDKDTDTDKDSDTDEDEDTEDPDITPIDGIIVLPGEDILTPTPTITPTPEPEDISDPVVPKAADDTDDNDDNDEEPVDNNIDNDTDAGDSTGQNNDSDSDDGTDDEEINENTTENSEETEEETAVSPEEVLNDYENNVLPSEIPYGSFSGTSVSYTYGDGTGAAAAINGRLTERQQDLDGDGIPELLVVEMQSGKIAFRVYKVSNGTVEMTASQTISAGMENAVESFSYGSTQTCFLMNNNGTYEIGLASYCYGYDSGDETPAVRTYTEVYSVSGDGSTSLCASGSVQNGDGQDAFSASLAPAGMNGSWNSSNVETLQSMGYSENPYQDAAGVPNPLSSGVSESGAETLAVVEAQMAAGSGELTVK